MGGGRPCVIATESEIIYFNNTKSVLAKTQRYSFKGIGSIKLEQKKLLRRIVLGLSVAGEEEIDISCRS